MTDEDSLRTFDIGGTTVTALPDGAANLGGWPMSPELDGGNPVDWTTYARRFPTGFHGAGNHWRIHNTCYLVAAGGQRVLVDCGVGVGPYARYAGLRGQLPRMLEVAGVAAADIDVVLLTHAHPDHVGWAFDEDADLPRFPRARYLLHRADYHEYSRREPVPRYFSRFVEPLNRHGCLELLDHEREIAPGVTALWTPGHTPGHMSVLVRGGDDGLVIAGDVLNSPMFVTEPGRPFGADLDSERATRTRIALVERIEAEGWKVAAAHFPAPGVGRVSRDAGKRWFVPLP